MTDIHIHPTYPTYPSSAHLHPLPSTSINSASSIPYASSPTMVSPVHKQPAPYYYSQAPPSSHSPQQHHSSHSQASTPFTTASSVHSPPLSHQLAHPATAIGYPPFTTYSDHPTTNGHSHSYSSNGAYHTSPGYDGYGVSTHNALQLQPPLDTSIAYHPSLPSAAGGGATNYLPARPSPWQHSHSQRIIPGVQQMSGRGQPASTAQPRTEQTHTAINTLPPIGNTASGVSVGASTASKAQGHSTPPPAVAVVGADGQQVRKRPKYTRSKAGCLVCRQKKVKCDEKKPICTRCMHGHRECSWPKDIPTSAANKNKAPKSIRGVERDLDGESRNDNVDDDDDELPQSADPETMSFSPVQPPSAVSTYAGEAFTTASTSSGFGAPGASYSYPYGGQGALHQTVAQTTASQAHSRNNSSGSSGGGYSLGAPEAGPEPLAPYFRTGQERNLVGLTYSDPLHSVPSLSNLPTSPSHHSHNYVPSWPLAPRISLDRCSPSPSLSPSSSSSFDVSSLLPSPASSFPGPSYSSLGLTVPEMSPTSIQSPLSSGSSYAAPQPFIPATGLEWLRLEDFPASSKAFIGYQ